MAKARAKSDIGSDFQEVGLLLNAGKNLFEFGGKLSHSTINCETSPDTQSAEILTVRGCWADLTCERISRLLGWSLARPGRSFGLELVADQSSGGLIPEPVSGAKNPVGLAGPDGLFEVGQNGRRQLSEAAFYERLSGSGAFAVLVVTGHGAEHCLAFGAGWLASSVCFGLAGPIIEPDKIRVPLIFLNGCSTLRLGDSVVPEHHSLAARFTRSGATVLGPNRNLCNPHRLESTFIALALAKIPAAQIAHHLNCLLRDEEDIPCIVTLGNPLLRLAGQPVPNNAPPLPRISRMEVEDLTVALRNARLLLRLYRDLRSWMWSMNSASDAMPRLDTAIKTALIAVATGCHPEISTADLRTVTQNLLRCQSAMAETLLDDIARWIRSGRWIEGAYAPVNRRAIEGVTNCSSSCANRCRGAAGALVDYRFDDPAGIAPSIFVRECDRCGSVAEWVGDPPPTYGFDFIGNGTCASINAPPLPENSVGRILIHRAPEVEAEPWPSDGGTVALDLANCPIHGRITAVALCVGPGGLVVRYSHMYRHPSTGVMHPKNGDVST